MSFLSTFNISGSGMTAQKYRLDIISQNIANAQVTRTEGGGPYRRKMTVLSSVSTGTFQDALKTATAWFKKMAFRLRLLSKTNQPWYRFMIPPIPMLMPRATLCIPM